MLHPGKRLFLPQSKQVAKPPINPMNKIKTAFIADDDPEDLEMLCEVIKEIDKTVHLRLFSTGKEVLTHLLACKDQDLPHFLILDYNMRELTAWQVLKEIRNHPRYASIIKYVISTSAVTRFKEECLSSGAAAYFVKPSSFKDLRDIVQQMLTGNIDGTGSELHFQ
jgi:CheY-like chemotaxis protein